MLFTKFPTCKIHISGKMHILTEFCPGGSLRKLLIDSRVCSLPGHVNMVSTLNHRQLLKNAVDVANGMVHLSSQKVLVRQPRSQGFSLAWGLGKWP